MKMSMAAGASLGLGGLGDAPAFGAAPDKKGKGGRLLILGGTGFLGPAVAEAAQKAGYTITLFNRGKTNPGLFPDIEKLHGDRDGGLGVLKGRTWDAVVDTSGYVPRLVRASAEALKDAVQRYVFISSISVYRDTKDPPDESSPVRRIPDETVEKIEDGSYGALKALCEQAAEKTMPGRVLNIRPGYIVGPRDRSDRFTYWPVRVERGGDMLAPGTPADPIQIIDVRDLGDWIIHLIGAGTVGVWNAVGPAQTLTMGELLRVCQQVTGKTVKLTWVSPDFLDRQKAEVPIWVPAQGDESGFVRISPKRAIEHGLRFRPLPVTVKDTLSDWHALPQERRDQPRAGLSAAREAELLALWRLPGHGAKAEKAGTPAPKK